MEKAILFDTKTARKPHENWGSPQPQIGKHARLLPTCQRRCVCLETCRHARGTTGEDRALLECLADRQTDQAEALTIRAKQERGY